jgi:Ase1/PRC1/MAP65 family protein
MTMADSSSTTSNTNNNNNNNPQHKPHSSPVVRFASPERMTRATMSSPRTLEKQVKTTNHHTTNNHHHNQNPLDSSIATAATIHTIRNNTTAFTPILTPNRSGGSMIMLLSPARTIAESLTTLATSTGQQLEMVWDQVGYSPEDRASQISDLLTKFHDICEQKIAEERGVAETFRTTIAEQREEIMTTAAALRLDVESLLLPEQLHDDGGGHHVTLTDELAAVEATLEGLRGAATGARQDLQACRDFLVESHQALGLALDDTWNDVESDLTSRRRAAFHEKRLELKEQLATRTAAVVQLVRDCQHLMADLRIGENGTNESFTELDRRIAGSVVRSKDDSFIMASKFRSETCVGINSIAMEELTNRVAELSGEKRRRKQKLQEMGAEIACLWEKLRVSEEEQIAFTESVQGLGKDTIEKGEAELHRLHALKSQMLGKLIYEARQAITGLWDQINAPPDHRRSFEPFAIRDEQLFTDELLEQHEAYIVVLEARLEQMKPILRLIERREIIVQERMEYEHLQKDPDRLKQRGAELTRQLMEEEKMARRIKRDLPKLTELLNEKLDQWRKEHGEHFEYSRAGETYLAVMERQEQEWNAYKEEKHHLMLIKKQEDKVLVDTASSRFAAGAAATNHSRVVVGIKKAGGGAVVVGGGLSRQPLGDAQKKENARQHGVGVAVDAAVVSKPVRTMGTKQSSSRFKS